METVNDGWAEEERHHERLLWTSALWLLLAVAAAVAAAFDGAGATDTEQIVPAVVSATLPGGDVSR